MTVMSSTIEGTAQTGAAHRDTSPVWPFHLLLARIGWAFAYAYWGVGEFEHHVARKPRTAAMFLTAGLLMIVTAVITIAGGAL